MAQLQTSGAISLLNLQNVLGGGNPINFSEYYRGGAYTPATIGSNDGPRYSRTAPTYYVLYRDGTNAHTYVWNGTTVASGSGNVASRTVGSDTYTRGTLRSSETVYMQVGTFFYYNISRSSLQTVNTGVPSSGTISLSNMYGARNS